MVATPVQWATLRHPVDNLKKWDIAAFDRSSLERATGNTPGPGSPGEDSRMNTTTNASAPAATSHSTDRRTDHGIDHRDGDIRPLITRHRLRRRRRRTAATLLAGASIALGAAAMRSPGASAHAPAAAPVTETSQLPPASEQPPPAPVDSRPAPVDSRPAPVDSRPAPALVPTTEPPIVSSSEPKTDASTLDAPSAEDQADDDVQIPG
jgi:hypothetical protein